MNHPSDRTTVRRIPEKGVYEREAIYQILDEALFCHLGFVHDGAPFVIPTIHARLGDTVYVHGSAGSRMLTNLRKGINACLTVTILDGLVLARSVFEHSMNYRSVVILGTATEVIDRAEKLAVLEAVSDHVAPGRWRDARGPTDKELAKTRVLAIPLDESSAKVSTGPPEDLEEDYALDCWAGVIPVRLVPQGLQPDPLLKDGIEPPPELIAYAAPDGPFRTRRK
jgi:uncharacterized protein